MKKVAALVALVVCMSGIVASHATAAPRTATVACSTDHVHFAKTKFAFHVGIAVAAFQHWIYKPYKAGAFKKGAPGRTKALIKAGATGVVIVHELRIACQDANSSGTLRHLVKPINLLMVQLTRLSVALKHGHFDPNSISSAATAVGAVSGG